MRRLLLILVVNVVRGSSSIYDSIYQQIPTIQAVQNQVNDVDQNYLNPVASSNQNLLVDIHNASLMLANKSIMDLQVASNQADMASEKFDINRNSVPTMLQGLNSVRSTLLDQQRNNRYYAMLTAGGVWSKIENTTFVNFTKSVFNNTVGAITNLSSYVMPILVFDNVTTGPNNQTLASLSSRFRTALPLQVRKLQGIMNAENFINQSSSQFVSVTEPGGEARVDTAIRGLVNNSFGRFSSTNAANEQFQEKELTKNMNLTARNYNALFNNTVNNLVLSVSNNVNNYLSSVSTMQSLAQSTQDQAARVANLYALATTSSSVLQHRHEILLGTIKPVVFGIGSQISSLLAQVQSSIAAADGVLNSTVQTFNSQLLSTQSNLIQSFSQQVATAYAANTQQTSVSLQSAHDAIELKLKKLNSTIALMLANAQGNSSSRSQSSSVSAQDANLTADSAAQVVNAMKQAVFDAIQSQFSQFVAAVNIKLGNLNGTTLNNVRTYQNARRQLLSTLASGQSAFVSSANALVENLKNNRIKQFTAFNQSLQTYPSVSDASVTQPIQWRVGNLSILEAEVRLFDTSLSAMVNKMVPRFNQLQTVFSNFNETAFVANLNAVRDALFAESEKNLTHQIEASVAAYNASNQSLNAQVDQAVRLIQTNMNAFGNVYWSPAAVDINAITRSADSLLRNAQATLASVQQAVSQLVVQYAANVSEDDTGLNEKIGEEISKFQRDSSEAISANASTLGARNALGSVLGNIAAQLDYSDDQGKFNTAIQSVRDNLQRIGEDLSQAATQIDMSFQSAVQNSQSDLNQIQTALGMLISASQKILSHDTRISIFSNSSRSAIDAAVNATRDSVFRSISGIYSRSLDAFQDYMQYVNGSAGLLRASTASGSAAVTASSMELKKIQKKTKSMFEDGRVLSAIQQQKSVKIHQELDDIAKYVLQSALDSNRGALNATVALGASEIMARNALLSNLSQFNTDYLKHLSFFTNAVQRDSQTANRSISDAQESVRRRLESQKKDFERDISNLTKHITASADDTSHVLQDIANVDGSINSRAANTHASLNTVMNALNSTSFSMKPSSNPLKTLLTKYAAVAKSLTDSLPDLLKAEINQEDKTVRDQGLDIENVLSQHESPPLDPQLATQKLSRVHILQDLVDDTRSRLKRSTLRVQKPKNYTSEVNEIRSKLHKLDTDHDNFIHHQEVRVERWLKQKTNL